MNKKKTYQKYFIWKIVVNVKECGIYCKLWDKYEK